MFAEIEVTVLFKDHLSFHFSAVLTEFNIQRLLNNKYVPTCFITPQME